MIEVYKSEGCRFDLRVRVHEMPIIAVTSDSNVNVECIVTLMLLVVNISRHVSAIAFSSPQP